VKYLGAVVRKGKRKEKKGKKQKTGKQKQILKKQTQIRETFVSKNIAGSSVL
jgi:hypothetical protein